MNTELILMCHGATHAMKAGLFPAVDDPVDHAERMQIARIARLAEAIKPDYLITGDALAARETARAFAVEARPSASWNDVNYGAWAGRPIRDIHDTDPDGLSAWLTDPSSAAHGGESVAACQQRVADAMTRFDDDGITLVITHAIVVKTALAHVLRAPLQSIYSMDLEPLSTITFTRMQGEWRLRCRAMA